MLFWQILIDGFAISSLYALGATGFALIFGVSGVLNLSHGALMVAAVVAAWAAGNDLHAGPYAGALIGVAVGFVASMLTYFVDRAAAAALAQNPRGGKGDFHPHRDAAVGHHAPGADRLYLHQQRQDRGADRRGRGSIVGVRTPSNEIFTAVVCWLVIGAALARWSIAPAPARRCSPRR